jgi:hypothetical protein
MAKRHESKSNLGDLTDAEIYAAIRYLEQDPKAVTRRITVSSSASVYLSHCQLTCRSGG